MENPGFVRAYFLEVKGILTLILVCACIAFLTNLMNSLGYWTNLMFSFSYGFPISIIETFLATRKRPLPEWLIAILSVFLGSMVGTATVYSHLVSNGIMEFGVFGYWFYINFGAGILLSAIAFHFFWSRYRNQSLQLEVKEQQLKLSEQKNLRQQAENRLLQSQMEPHFLFNTLANIQSLVDIDPAQAKKMIGNLSNMLRASLANSSNDFCTLQQELDLVGAYLDIQKVRLGDRLLIQETIATTTDTSLVLPMTIQPLVENAIKHAVEKSVTPVTLTIDVTETETQLCITVTNSLVEHQSSTEGNGISLRNIRKRLENQFGDRANLSSKPAPSGWQACLCLPLIQPEGNQ